MYNALVFGFHIYFLVTSRLVMGNMNWVIIIGFWLQFVNANNTHILEHDYTEDRKLEMLVSVALFYESENLCVSYSTVTITEYLRFHYLGKK